MWGVSIAPRGERTMTLAFVCVCFNAHYIQAREGNFKIPSLLHFLYLREVGCRGGEGLNQLSNQKSECVFPV